MSDKFEICALVRKLNEATKQYDLGHPIMSDKEWDNLYFKLQELEKETGIQLSNSPTNVIYWTKVDSLEKVKHNHPMLSLDKTKDVHEITNFLKGQPFVGMFKMDGLTCSLTYEKGFLVSAETRGNGLVGEDILHNMFTVQGVPTQIPYTDKLVVDGEVICRKDDFIPFIEEYKNPRNFAAGSIRLLAAKECEQRNLSFIAWEMIEGYPEIKEFWKRLDKLEEMCFTVVPFVSDISKVEDALDILQEKSEHDIYPTDGYVFKFNDVEYGKKQGQTDHHLKNAIAFKLYDEIYETEVKDIEWTMGRTGQLTPVLIYNDIEIDGAICNRASLHNISVMTQLMGGAFPGQRVFIYKANQIIPQVESAQDNNPNHIPGIQIPKICPYCGKPTEIRKDNDSEVLYCTNPQCEGKLVNKLNHFCGKKGLDINGLSKATLNKFIDWNWVATIEDLYYISEKYRSDFLIKPGFGNKSVTKILDAIERSKHTTLNAFISAMGIPLIGRTAAADLAKEFKTYEDFRNAVDDKNYHFFYLPNFGEEMDYQLKHFNYSEMDKLSKILILENPVVNNEITNNSLEGKTIVITGKLTNFKNRNELKEVIKAHGGKTSDSISNKTDILINNDIESTSSKNKKAKQLNIPILSEVDFIQSYLEN